MNSTPKKYHEFCRTFQKDNSEHLIAQGRSHIVSTLTNNSQLSALRADLANHLLPNLTVEIFESTLLPRLADRGWIDQLMNQMLDRQCFDPIFFPDLRVIDSGYFNALEIFTHPKLSILLSLVDHAKIGDLHSDNECINIMSFTTYLYFIQASGAKIEFFEAELGSCCSRRIIDIKDGMLLKVAGAKNSMKFLSADNDLVVLGVSFFETDAKECFKINASDAQIVSKSSSDMPAQRAFMYSSILALLGEDRAIDAMKKYLKHADPELRWHIMREILALDADRASPLLHELATSDPSVRVRQIAKATIDKFNL